MLVAMRLAALALAISTLGAGAAAADGLTARFGLTYGFFDKHGPDTTQMGPLVALGLRAGAFVGELEWSHLSFFDPDASPGGVQRVGLTLRAELLRARAGRRLDEAKSLYVEGGADERFGRWFVDGTRTEPAVSPQPEVHLGAGLEYDSHGLPNRNGWQLGVRYTVARADSIAYTACLSSGGGGCPATTSSGGLEHTLFVEWMFVIGR